MTDPLVKMALDAGVKLDALGHFPKTSEVLGALAEQNARSTGDDLADLATLATIAEEIRRHALAMEKADPDGRIRRFIELVKQRRATVIAHPSIVDSVRAALGPEVTVVANPLAEQSYLYATTLLERKPT